MLVFQVFFIRQFPLHDAKYRNLLLAAFIPKKNGEKNAEKNGVRSEWHLLKREPGNGALLDAVRHNETTYKVGMGAMPTAKTPPSQPSPTTAGEGARQPCIYWHRCRKAVDPTLK